MKSLWSRIVCILLFCSFISVNAKSIYWSILPKYDKISRYHFDIYACKQLEKWGLYRPNNVEILSPSCDFITPYVNGYVLAGIREEGKFLLKSIVDKSGTVTYLQKKYFLSTNYHYFSEGKLVVFNVDGKYGYINPFGTEVIKCQFDNAFPFKEGYAAVKLGNYVKYINDSYDSNPSRSILIVNFHNGEMTAGSCFSNGNAVVAYNKDFMLIGKNGSPVKKINETEFKRYYVDFNQMPQPDYRFTLTNNYTEYEEKGLMGLKQDGSIIALPQFNFFSEKYDDGNIIAGVNGKVGLLNIIESDYSITFSSISGSKSVLEVDKNGTCDGIILTTSFPNIEHNFNLMVDCGDGKMHDYSSQINSNNDKIALTPFILNNSESYLIKASLKDNGLLVVNAEHNFSVSYPIILSVTPPLAMSSRANENDNVTIYSDIYNDSMKAVTVTAKLLVNDIVTETIYTIEPHSQVKITRQIKVTEKQNVKATVTLSSGESATSNIYLEPYF